MAGGLEAAIHTAAIGGFALGAEVLSLGTLTPAVVAFTALNIPGATHGLAEMIIGVFESDCNPIPELPPVSLPALVALIIGGGDIETAKEADLYAHMLDLFQGGKDTNILEEISKTLETIRINQELSRQNKAKGGKK
jgi:hypothetical protein